MTPDQREALRQEVIRWIGSKEFDGYMTALHHNPMELAIGLPIALLATVFHAAGLWPWDVIRGMNERGLATPSTRRRYLKLAETGKVSLGYICNPEPFRTDVKQDCAPAHILASIGGTTEDDELVESCLAMNAALRPLATNGNFPSNFAGSPNGVFRAGKSEFDYGEPASIYIFNTFLHKSAAIPAKGRPHVVCIVNPDCWPTILPVPFAIAKSCVPTLIDEKPAEPEQPDWLKKAYPAWREATHDFVRKRIKRERKAFYDSLSLVEQWHLWCAISPTLKTVELDAVICAFTGQNEKLSEHLANGVSPDVEGLMYLAIIRSNVKAVELLLARGANPNKPVDGAGNSYLHEAAMHNQMAMVEMLLAIGADPNKKNKSRKRPLDYARERKHERAAVIGLLEPVMHQPKGKITYRVDDFLEMADPEEAYYALCAAIRNDPDRTATLAELRILALSEFTGLCMNNGFTNIYWQGTWAVVPCAELMEAIDEPVFAGRLQQCIAIVTEYGKKIGRDPFDDDDGALSLDEETENKLDSPELDFIRNDLSDYERLYRKTMDYVRKNRGLFAEPNQP